MVNKRVFIHDVNPKFVCSECGSNSVYVNLSLNVNDYYEGELHNAILGETTCDDCGNEGALGCFGTKEKDN